MSRPTGPTPGSAAEQSPPADPEQFARNILLRQLTAGPRTRAQLREALARRNVPADIAERLLARFTEIGLIDDEAFAESMIRRQAAAGGLSRRRVEHRLLQKGVSREVAESAVATIDPQEEYRSALDLAMRQQRRLAGLEPAVARRRLAGVLARRGYPPDTVRGVVEEVIGGVLDSA